MEAESSTDAEDGVPSDEAWDMDPTWRKKESHYFVFTNAGKPVYSRHGDESDLGSYFALMYALVSVAEEDGDRLECIETDFNRTLFCRRGPIYLVSACNLCVPESASRRHLHLLHMQLLAILTKGVEKTLHKRPSFDVRSLLGGTRPIMDHLVDSFSFDPGYAVGALESLVWSSQLRRGADAAVLTMAVPGVLCCVLLYKGRLVGLAESRKNLFPVDDILLLNNLVSSGPSLRETEHFSPVCMPTYNPNSFLYVYVTYFGKETCLAVVSHVADVFGTLTSLRPKVEAILNASKIVHTHTHEMSMKLHIDDIPQLAGGGPIGTTPLWHFLHLHKTNGQYVMSEFRPPLCSEKERKEVCTTYLIMHEHSKQNRAKRSSGMHFEVSDRFVTLALTGSEYELLLIFDPLTEHTMAVRLGNLLLSWLRTQEPLLFFSRRVFR